MLESRDQSEYDFIKYEKLVVQEYTPKKKIHFYNKRWVKEKQHTMRFEPLSQACNKPRNNQKVYKKLGWKSPQVKKLKLELVTTTKLSSQKSKTMYTQKEKKM